jgi:hypothetical protein
MLDREHRTAALSYRSRRDFRRVRRAEAKRPAGKPKRSDPNEIFFMLQLLVRSAAAPILRGCTVLGFAQ